MFGCWNNIKSRKQFWQFRQICSLPSGNLQDVRGWWRTLFTINRASPKRHVEIYSIIDDDRRKRLQWALASSYSSYHLSEISRTRFPPGDPIWQMTFLAPRPWLNVSLLLSEQVEPQIFHSNTQFTLWHEGQGQAGGGLSTFRQNRTLLLIWK